MSFGTGSLAAKRSQSFIDGGRVLVRHGNGMDRCYGKDHGFSYTVDSPSNGLTKKGKML
ncbi:hypothetical protein [Pasteuria penetrans]|uniref:hypothetical protein n=1 Tax=Pasteuria penetrans TaxID=86005 RepID=UPI000FAB7DA2|nr:hypothetical protein [Pasteuria penetrans]